MCVCVCVIVTTQEGDVLSDEYNLKKKGFWKKFLFVGVFYSIWNYDWLKLKLLVFEADSGTETGIDFGTETGIDFGTETGTETGTDFWP